jgi:hypothetical protein
VGCASLSRQGLVRRRRTRPAYRFGASDKIAAGLLASKALRQKRFFLFVDSPRQHLSDPHCLEFGPSVERDFTRRR